MHLSLSLPFCLSVLFIFLIVYSTGRRSHDRRHYQILRFSLGECESYFLRSFLNDRESERRALIGWQIHIRNIACCVWNRQFEIDALSRFSRTIRSRLGAGGPQSYDRNSSCISNNKRTDQTQNGCPDFRIFATFKQFKLNVFYFIFNKLDHKSIENKNKTKQKTEFSYYYY